MAQEVTIGGKKFPKWGIYASVAGGLGVIGFVYYKHKQNASAATDSGAGTDPVTGLPYAEDNTVDPLTGMTYLDEAQEYGSVSAAESAVQSGSADDYSADYGDLYDDSDTGTLEEVPYSSFSGVETGSNYTSNAEWTQAATAGLGDLGYAATDIAAALGNYLAGLPLTSGQEQIVYAAIAEYGEPPTPAPAITLTPATTPSTTGNTTTTPATVQVPYVVGKNLAVAIATIENAGLKEHTITTGIANPSNWTVAGQNPAGGMVAAGSTIDVSATQKK